MDRKGGRTLGPPSGRSTFTVFIDDVNLPLPNAWGDQPALELLRQLIETQSCSNLAHDRRGESVRFEGLRVRLFASTSVRLSGEMNEPGCTCGCHQYVAAARVSGGTNDSGIPSRLRRHFVTVNLDALSSLTVEGIFGTILSARSVCRIVCWPEIAVATILLCAAPQIWFVRG